MIVEQAPALEGPVAVVSAGVRVVRFVLSGGGVGGLRGLAARLLVCVEGGGAGLSLVDVGFSSVVSRAVLEHRGVIAASDREEWVRGLGSLAGGEMVPSSVVRGAAGPVGGMAFVFTGQGAQRLGMGRGLY
ncbi:hypothetical protein, partial [Streptomyces sp. BE133]|uniref:hypothetical protein n=1 Tax=Streptomyces sp. BE133 TaxID=3002523 RepID=UPI002E7852CE